MSLAFPMSSQVKGGALAHSSQVISVIYGTTLVTSRPARPLLVSSAQPGVERGPAVPRGCRGPLMCSLLVPVPGLTCVPVHLWSHGNLSCFCSVPICRAGDHAVRGPPLRAGSNSLPASSFRIQLRWYQGRYSKDTYDVSGGGNSRIN